jgi:TetR/AcrR family transcriptional repressor of nem operon
VARACNSVPCFDGFDAVHKRFFQNSLADGPEHEAEQSALEVFAFAHDIQVDVGGAVRFTNEGVSVTRCASPQVGVGGCENDVVGVGPIVVQALPDAARTLRYVGLGTPLLMNFQVLVGTVAEELRAAGPEVGEAGNVLLGRQAGCLVKMDGGHVLLLCVEHPRFECLNYDIRHTSCMMIIIDGGCRKRMRYPAKETAAKHERIVKEASRLFRERGFDNVTVGEVMKAAGLTHGAFYAHFDSKQDLQKAAIAYGQGVSAGIAKGYAATKKGQRSYADRYLSPRHRDNPGNGCTMAALGQEVARSTPELKAVFERGLEEYLSAKSGDRKVAIFQSAAMIGALVLARAVRDPRLSDEVLKVVRQKLS